MSADGKARAHISWSGNLIPLAHEVIIDDPRKFELIQDWIEQALTKTLGEAHADNYIKDSFTSV